MTAIYALAVIGGTGLVCGLVLAIAAKVFHVQENPHVAHVNEILPGANCGGCGFAGCADYAKAVVLDDAEINLCAPAGCDIVTMIGEILGKSAEAGPRKVAMVLCRGDNDVAGKKFYYNGVADCKSAASVHGGDKQCSYGCLGYGSCARVCPVGAIEITDGQIAIVHTSLCIGCGACVRTCPRTLIKMVPDIRSIHVMCSSKDKGKVVKKACKVGCIGCSLCVKRQEGDAISMDGAIAVVDYEKNLTSEIVIEKCPAKCILNIDLSEKPDRPEGSLHSIGGEKPAEEPAAIAKEAGSD